MPIEAHIVRWQGGQSILVSEGPDSASAAIVVMVPGTPQTRVGTRRQFVLLARRLAENGISTVRFDRAGFGDSEGACLPLEPEAADLAAVMQHTKESTPGGEPVWLLGLCDDASQAALFAAANTPISGLILLNPWLEDTDNHNASENEAQFTHPSEGPRPTGLLRPTPNK